MEVRERELRLYAARAAGFITEWEFLRGVFYLEVEKLLLERRELWKVLLRG